MAKEKVSCPDPGLAWFGDQEDTEREAKDRAATWVRIKLTGSLVAPEEPIRREKPQSSQALGLP